MWRAAVDCSRHEPQQLEKLGHRRLITAYDGWQATTTRRNVVDVVPRNPPAHEVRRQGTTVLLPAATCRQGERACSQSSPPPSANEVREEAEWWGRTSTMGTPAGQRSSLPTLELTQRIPAMVAFPWSSRDKTSDVASSDWKTDLGTGRRVWRYIRVETKSVRRSKLHL